jgi:iron complex transport system ATP-binding protein
MQIKAEQLYLGYDEENIVKNLSMTPPIGKISVILGANGCGKSTLLKSFARLLDARKGQITLDEKSLSSYKTKTLSTHIGLLPQNPVVPEGISVMDLVLREFYCKFNFYNLSWCACISKSGDVSLYRNN